MAKTHGSGDWFDGWLCARMCRCRFDFCQCEMTRGKIVLDGKSKENLEKNCGIQFFFLVFLSFWTARAYPKLKQFPKIHFRRRLALFGQKNGSGLGIKAVPFLRKSATDSREIRHRFWGKSVINFKEIRHRFWGNPSPTFGKIRHRLLGKIRHRLLGKTRHRF